MLQKDIVQAAQLLPSTILQRGSVHDGADMGAMYQARAIVASSQAFHCFFILVARLRESLNCAPGRPLLDGLLQVDQSFSIREALSAMD